MTIQIFGSKKAGVHNHEKRLDRNEFLQKHNKNNLSFFLINTMIMIFNTLPSVNSLIPDNFHISLSENSTYSKNFEKIKPLDYRHGNVISNLTVYVQTINKEDSAILKIEKSNAEISTSASSLYDVNNEDFFVSKNDYLIEYVYPTSTIMSQFQDRQVNSTNSEKIIKCNYFVNSPNLSYNWVNVLSYKATARYSFLTFVLKQNGNGVFYLNYKADNNELKEISVNSDNYDLNSDKYIKIWFIEQKFIENDYMILAKEKVNDYELIVFNIRIDDLMKEYLSVSINFYTKIQIKANLYEQINKIGYYKDQFILATKRTGLVILYKSVGQAPPNSNDTSFNITNADNYLLSNDPIWTTKTTINNFKSLNRFNQSYEYSKNDYNNKNLNYQKADEPSTLNYRFKRSLQSNLTINSSLSTNNTSNDTDVKNTNSSISMNVAPTNNITLININVLDMTINEFTIYLIIEKKGLFIINLENFQISEEFRYENPHFYKLEFFNNVFLGNKFIGLYAENPDSSSQELYVELLIDEEMNPSANKVFTSQNFFGKGKATSYDDLFTLILNIKEKKIILIRKGMLNSIPFMTHILDISSYIKFELENTEFVSLFDSSNKKVFYSLYNMDLIIPFNITFTDEFINCKFSESGKYEMNFIQKSEICRESINSNKAYSFCERNLKYSIEVVGPPSSDVQQILLGVLIALSIILVGLIIFTVVKTDGCKNIKYFKIIKTAQIRERLYYDAGQDINIEGNKQREILSQRVVMNNQPALKSDDEIDKNNNNNENLNVMPSARSFRFVFNPEIKNVQPNPQIKSLIEDNYAKRELRIERKSERDFEDLKTPVSQDIYDENISENVFDFKNSIKERLKIKSRIEDDLDRSNNVIENNPQLKSNQSLNYKENKIGIQNKDIPRKSVGSFSLNKDMDNFKNNSHKDDPNKNVLSNPEYEDECNSMN